MKKIIFMMVAMIGFAMNAQTYTEPSIFDNTYVSLRYGVTSMMHPDGFKDWSHNLAGQSTLQFGKWITPRTGFALEGTASWDTFSHQKWSDYTVPFMTVNVLGKYMLIDEKPCSMVLAAGPGWMHHFVKNDRDGNNLMAKFELEINYHVTDRVTINFVPELAYNLTPYETAHYKNNQQVKISGHSAWYGFNMGLTYRLGDKFKECPYTYTQGEVDHLNEQINDLRAALAEKPKQVVTEKEVIKTIEVVKSVQNVYTVMFAKNSAELTNESKAMLNEVAGNVEIVATASPEGSERRNNELSQERANVVKDYLTNRGINVISALGIGVDGPTSNRVATVIVK